MLPTIRGNKGNTDLKKKKIIVMSFMHWFYELEQFSAF